MYFNFILKLCTIIKYFKVYKVIILKYDVV